MNLIVLLIDHVKSGNGILFSKIFSCFAASLLNEILSFFMHKNAVCWNQLRARQDVHVLHAYTHIGRYKRDEIYEWKN